MEVSELGKTEDPHQSHVAKYARYSEYIDRFIIVTCRPTIDIREPLVFNKSINSYFLSLAFTLKWELLQQFTTHGGHMQKGNILFRCNTFFCLGIYVAVELYSPSN